jgi:hypothetical protein
MSDSAKVSNSKPLDAAPPETDLRAMSDEMLISAYGDAVSIWSALMNRHAVNDEDQLRVMRSTRAEIERRMARPDALREKVMAAIDDWWNSWRDEDIDALKAAVVAVLEETS